MKKTVAAVQAAVLIICIMTAFVGAYSAQAMAVMELSTGTFLSQKNADVRMPMASTTKIMTALVVLENSSLDAEVRIPASAVGVEGSSMYLVKDEVLTVEELLYGLMLTSGNDAAEALAYFVGGGSTAAFIKLMNDKADFLGLTDTSFTNPSGLPDDNHYTTANELAKITAAALENPIFEKIVQTRTVTIRKNGQSGGRTLVNHNRLLSMYEYAVGVKTGFTKKAGRCLVSAAKKDSVTLICVTLNDPDDWQDHITAFEEGFERTEYVCLADKGSEKITLSAADGALVQAENSRALHTVVIDGKLPQKLIKAPRFVYAPKSPGDAVGSVCYQLGGKTVASADLCITQPLSAPVEKELFISRIIKYIRNLF